MTSGHLRLPLIGSFPSHGVVTTIVTILDSFT
jgi:hypothetical protein